MNKIVHIIITLLFIALLAGCGNGGSSQGKSSTIKAVIKTSSLTANQNVAGVQLSISLPIGVSPILKADGITVDTAATVSITSPTQNQTLPGVTYTKATAAALGQITIAGIASGGFGPTDQDQVTIHLVIADDASPTESDFNLLSFLAFDSNGNKVFDLHPPADFINTITLIPIVTTTIL